jgi:hypothetical protein
MGTRPAGFPLFAPRRDPNRATATAIPPQNEALGDRRNKASPRAPISPCERPLLRSFERSGERYVAYSTVPLRIASAAARFRTAADDSTKSLVLQAPNAFSILCGEWLTPAHRALHRSNSID